MKNLYKELNPTRAQNPRLKNLHTVEDVALFLGIPCKKLLYVLYKEKPTNKYKSFSIEKRNGDKRIINAPIGNIKSIQKNLLPCLLEVYTNKECVHGFVKNKSILTNAQAHKNAKYRTILNIDLKNFYDTITFPRVRGLLMSEKTFSMGERAATVIAQALCFEGKIPQGACTSPVISNMILRRLDSKIINICRKSKCTYSRYADDITISWTSRKTPPLIIAEIKKDDLNKVVELSKNLREIIEDEKFIINESKVRISTKQERQEITGLTVNEFPNIRRKFIMDIRGMINAWRKYGLDKAAIEFNNKYSRFRIKEKNNSTNIENYFKSVLYGKMAYVYMIRAKNKYDALFIKYAKKIYPNLDKNPPKFMKEEAEKTCDIFISYASEDRGIAKNINNKLQENGIKTFFDVDSIGYGDSITKRINDGIAISKIFLPIITYKYTEKRWTNEELWAAVYQKVENGFKVFPVLVGDINEIKRKLPLVVDKKCLLWNNNIDEIIREASKMLSSLETI